MPTLAVFIDGESFALECRRTHHAQPDYAALARLIARRWNHALSASRCALVALVVFLRGVNVGGHRRLRPSILARELRAYDVVNVGAAGTFVVRKPGSRARFQAAVRRKLPFAAEVVICDGRDLIRLEADDPFAAERSRPDTVRFVSILSHAGRVRPGLPIALPPRGKWLLRVIASQRRFVFGLYRRHMRTIGFLGQLDRLFGAPATTRNWNTIVAIVRILKGGRVDPAPPRPS